jgi:hypothetical protein
VGHVIFNSTISTTSYGEQMMYQCITFLLEYLVANSYMVHIVSHDNMAQGIQLVQDNLSLCRRTAASVDTLKQYTFTVNKQDYFIKRK